MTDKQLSRIGLGTGRDIPAYSLLSEESDRLLREAGVEYTAEQRERLATVKELFREFVRHRGPETPALTTPREAAEFVRPQFAGLEHEILVCVYLNRSKRVIEASRVTEGGLTDTPMDVRRIIKRALEVNASAVVLAHNHPSGNPRPSTSDINGTAELKKAAAPFNISLLDHIIITRNGYFSFTTETENEFNER